MASTTIPGRIRCLDTRMRELFSKRLTAFQPSTALFTNLLPQYSLNLDHIKAIIAPRVIELVKFPSLLPLQLVEGFVHWTALCPQGMLAANEVLSDYRVGGAALPA